MDVVTRIQVGTKGYLDLTANFIAPLNFLVSSVQNISSRSGVFSKTIKLKGTPNNNKLLSFLYKVNITDGTFDPNIKESIIIIKNGVTQFEGNMQLISVIKSSPSFLGLDENVEYEVAVKDDVGDFYSSMADKFLETLNEFSGTTYNHILDFETVFGTSGNTSDDVYKYFMPYHLRSYYSLPDFNLAISAKAYWDAIWKEEGYSYDWSSMSATGFDRLWVPYNGDRPSRDVSPLSFKASFSSDTGLITLGKMPPIPNSQEWYSYQNGSGFMPGAAPITVVFNDDSTSGITGNLFDPSNSYITNTGQFNSQFVGACEFKTRYKFEIYLNNPGPDDIRFEVAGTTDPADYTLSFKAALSGLTAGVSQNAYTNNIYQRTFNYTYLPAGVDTFMDECTIDEQAGILMLKDGPSTHVRNFFGVENYTIDTLNGDWCRISDDGPVAANLLPILKIKFIGLPSGSTNYNINYFKNSPSTSVEENSPIILKNFIPKQVQRRQFISSIISMFNLYISQTDNEKVLKVETRDEFYNNGSTRDWTNKIDIGDGISLKFLPDLQSKKLLFTYKADTDVLNKVYTEATGEIYGQFQYEFASEFLKDTKKVELIFSPTPLIKNKFNLVVPSITDRAPKNNIRILYDGGNISTPGLNTWTYSGETFPFSYTFDTYTYLGHLDNPYIPETDYDFGYNDFMFYDDWFYLTDNNLYNTYYRRYISQIESGKLLTAKFRLTELDIATLNLRDRIYVYDNYYFINKIIDYDCNSVDGLTNVELINVDEGLKFSAKKTTSKVSGTPVEIIGGNGNSNFSANRSAGGGGSTTSIYGSGSYSNTDNGEFNIFQPNTSFNTVNGQGNNIAGNSNVVQGDSNNSMGSNNNIIGNGNTLG